MPEAHNVLEQSAAQLTDDISCHEYELPDIHEHGPGCADCDHFRAGNAIDRPGHVHDEQCGHLAHGHASEHVDHGHVHTENCGHVPYHAAAVHIDCSSDLSLHMHTHRVAAPAHEHRVPHEHIAAVHEAPVAIAAAAVHINNPASEKTKEQPLAGPAALDDESVRRHQELAAAELTGRQPEPAVEKQQPEPLRRAAAPQPRAVQKIKPSSPPRAQRVPAEHAEAKAVRAAAPPAASGEVQPAAGPAWENAGPGEVRPDAETRFNFPAPAGPEPAEAAADDPEPARQDIAEAIQEGEAADNRNCIAEEDQGDVSDAAEAEAEAGFLPAVDEPMSTERAVIQQTATGTPAEMPDTAAEQVAEIETTVEQLPFEEPAAFLTSVRPEPFAADVTPANTDRPSAANPESAAAAKQAAAVQLCDLPYAAAPSPPEAPGLPGDKEERRLERRWAGQFMNSRTSGGYLPALTAVFGDIGRLVLLLIRKTQPANSTERVY